MSAYVLTLLAKTDVFDIWTYIASHSEEAANRVEEAITMLPRLSPSLPCAAILAPTSRTGRCVSGH